MKVAAKISRQTLLPPGLPPSWGWSRLRWVSRIYAGGTPSRDKPEFWFNGSIPWLNSGAVNQWSISEPSELITSEALGASSARWIPAKSVVIALAGQGKTKGMAARLEIESTCNQSMAALVPSSKLDYRYLHYWLASNYESIRNLGGGDLRDGLNLQMIGDIDIPLPPIDEQRRIADFLDDQVGRIDQAIGLRGRQEAAYSDLLESRIEELIYGLKELPSSEPSGGHLAATIAVNRAPSEWRRCRLKSVAQRSRAIRGDTSAPLLSLSSQGFLRTRADDQQPPADASLPRYLLVKPDDLVVNPMWLLGGAIAVSNMSGAVSPDYRAFHLDHSVAPRYVHHLLRSRLYMDQYKLYMRADTTFDRRVQQHDLDNMPIALPPRSEQVSRAAVLDRSASEALKIEEAFAGWKQVLEERKRALITAAVTGQLDVTVARPLTAPWVSSGLSASVESPVVSVGVAL